eukprot:3194679-Alexandrium_andersonii.AAC.1
MPQGEIHRSSQYNNGDVSPARKCANRLATATRTARTSPSGEHGQGKAEHDFAAQRHMPDG